MKTKLLFLGLVATMNLGCFGSGDVVGYAMNRTVDSAADRVGERIGDAVAANMLANNPQLFYAYSMSVFQMTFYQGGYYHYGSNDFEPGQWVRFAVTGYAEANTTERALLKRNEDGSEWWRVETRSTNDNGAEDVVIMEALFTAPDEAGTRRVVRMRSLIPGNTEPSEVPITEEDRDRWVVQGGQRLTKESAEGMKVGTSEVTTPAGKFTCDQLQTQMGNVTANWYVNEDVPGQFVRYTQDEDGTVRYSHELVAMGTDATTSKLGAF